MDYFMESLKLHEKLRGKIEVISKIKIRNKDDLSLAYTPGVAQPCLEIAKKPTDVYKYTNKANMVAVVSDGSAVLGLGNIGATASLPVMEGKAVLFKEFAGLDAVPIIIDSQDVEDIIHTVKMIAPNFGGINLEDISAPRCFEIEEQLKKELDIPVFHDDQHGTAVVVLAGLLNAAKITGKELKKLKVVVNGAGAAGIATTKILLDVGIKDIVVHDSKGAMYYCRDDMKLNKIKKGIAKKTNIQCKGKKGLPHDPKECERCLRGGLEESIVGRDVFIGVSKANLVTGKMVKTMAKDAIIFAMANPVPEIMPDEAHEAGAAVVATGRSDFPNQINNVLAFPNIFRGALDARARDINREMILAAAYALADSVKNPNTDKVIPGPFEKEYQKNISKAVYDAAVNTGVSRKF